MHLLEGPVKDAQLRDKDGNKARLPEEIQTEDLSVRGQMRYHLSHRHDHFKFHIIATAVTRSNFYFEIFKTKLKGGGVRSLMDLNGIASRWMKSHLPA